MKRKVIFAAMILGTASLTAQDSKIYVDMGSRGHDVPKSMYGIFFEEINHAGDGGLYGELLQNRGFEEHVLPGGMTYKDGRAYAPHSLNYYGLDYVDSWVEWNTENKKMQGWKTAAKGCTVKSSVETLDEPLHENTPNALRINISRAGGNAEADVINTGYWGVPTKSGAEYKVRFYLRTADYDGEVVAMICDKKNKGIGEISFDVIADGKWHEYTSVLTSSSTVSDGNFRLRFSQNGVIDIDYVSLFPVDTYKGRENGMRRDLAEALEGLHPSFLRWPGGCIVEGITLENRVKWKETLGDPMTRRGEFSLWGYRSTYGLGMHEFLQFCEDMNMDGMFVANVGLSCCLRNGDFIKPNDEESLTPYLQDICDAIEYAIGDPATNEWAAKRAEAGHPEPFPLKYVELGNENGTKRYADRWAFFYNTLKKEYPQITFITTLTYWEMDQIDKTDVCDVHWYVTPDEFYNDATLFDNQKRGDYTVYAGEYAANNNVGSGNMDAALSEAVFMGGMERNSDFVTMTSYAPLLTNVNQPNWSCNLIWFDTDRVMGRASYYVQKMYAENRPDYNVKTRLYSAGQALYSFGRIGFGTWNTVAEFRNLKVTSNDGSKTLYEADFSATPNHWTENGGEWSITKDGTWRQDADGTPCLNILNAYDFCDCTVEFEAKKISGAEGFLVMFGGDNDKPNVHYRVNIGGWGNTLVAFEKCDGGAFASAVTEKTPYTIKNGQWYKIKLVMEEGKSIRCYINGRLISTLETGDLFNGRQQAYGGYDEEAGEIVVKVVNAKDYEMTSEITLNGRNIRSTGKVITLAANSLSDENTLDEPMKIYPEESVFDGFAETFTYTFKPNSLTIFRIKADGMADAPLEIPDYEYDDTPVYLDVAEGLLATARAELERLVQKADMLAVDGAAGVAQLKTASAEAKEMLLLENATIKETKASSENLSQAIEVYVKGLMTKENDCTSKIKNADFKSMSTIGWKGSTPSLECNVGEFFNTKFDCYQVLTGLNPGKYLFTVQAFYREGSHEAAYAKHTDGTESLNAKMYAGDAETEIRSIYDQTFEVGSWNGYLDQRRQAEQAFAVSSSTMINYLICEVGTDGVLRLGLRKDTAVAFDWTCFNNFKLYYISAISTDISTVQFPEQDAHAIYSLQGIPMQTAPVREVYIMNGKKRFNNQ